MTCKRLHPYLTHRDFCLANHVRAATWAREDRSHGRTERSRWAAKVARQWWQRFLSFNAS